MWMVMDHHRTVRRATFIPGLLLTFASLATTGEGLKYVWGDALEDPLANGPDGNPYPWDMAAKMASKQLRAPRMSSIFGGSASGSGGLPEVLSPKETRDILLNAFRAQESGEYVPGKSYRTKESGSKTNGGQDQVSGRRQGRILKSEGNNNTIQGGGHDGTGNHISGDILATSSGDSGQGCVPSRLCPSTYNTTAPLYGVSLTSGQPVTIVQKFPDLLQQVVFQVCKTTECEVLQGECVQTYLPYLFLVIPLGPVTLTGQDYVLVESGCVCRPKYAKKHDEPPPLPFIQPLHP